MAEGAALEMPCTPCAYRGFESHPVRFDPKISVASRAGSGRFARFLRGSSRSQGSLSRGLSRFDGENRRGNRRVSLCPFPEVRLKAEEPGLKGGL